MAPLRSDLKLSIMLNLLDGRKKLAELKSDVNARETSILHVLKEFEALNLTTKSGGVYTLTSLGFMEAQIRKNQYLGIEVVEKFRDFWLSHDTKPLPAQLLLKIGALKDSNIVRSSETELSKVYEVFLQCLMSSTKVRGVSPIFHPTYVPAFGQLLSQGKTVELVLTSAVLNKTLTSANQKNLIKYFKEGSLRIYLNENLKFALTVTDTAFSLGLFTENGVYDDKMDLISLSPQAIEWGEELFEFTLKDSIRIGLEAVEDLG